MAPKTPQSNSKLPKAPSATGPVPLTSIPAPASVLQRRSFMPTPGGPSKTFKDMTPEQQALLAEAISMHSPGLIDPNRKPITSITTTASPSSGAGMVAAAAGGAALGFTSLQQSHYPSSPGNSSSSSPTPTGLSSPLSFRPSTQQIGRRPSQTKLGMTDPAQSPAITNATSNQFTRPSSYSGITPLATSASNLPQAGSAPSPTFGPGGTRTTAGSPSGSRSALTPSRLSAGATPRSTMMKQPLFQRPGPTTPTSAIAGPGLVNPSPTKANPLSAIPGSPALAPPSLDNYEIGDRVIVESMALTGYLRYLGPAEFKSGTWAGIELDTPTGKNDGSVNGVVYFTCRPKCGIFVLAAKIVKSELLFPTSPELAARPPSVEEDIPTPLPQINHAAQAASRITAGSRASKYIGMTATQLKQRNGTPMSSAAPSRSTSISIPGQAPGIRAASPTIRALGGKTSSPTTPRTLSGTANNRSGSPSPTQGPKQPLRANSPTTRTTLNARLSQTGPKPTLATLATKTGAHSRSTSSTSSVTSQSSATGARARTSPTPTRSLTAPRRLSSRSDTPEGNIISPSESRANLLDQASAIQMVSSPSDNVSLQLQQLQLDFDVAMAENSLLKSEVHDTKTQLEKALGREGSDGRLSQELEDLHLMKIVWEKEKAAKDQEIQVMTEKMTQAWLEAARSQKERTALIQEKSDLANRLQTLQENGAMGPTADAAEQQSVIETLKLNLLEADQKTLELEHKLQDLNARAIEEEERMAKAAEEYRTESEVRFLDQLEKITSDREAIQEQLTALEVSSSTTKDDLESQLEAALYKFEETKTQLVAVQHQLEDEAQTRVAAEYKTKEKFLKAEHDLSESQALHAKSEKHARGLEEKAKELEASIAKRDQEITGLKSEMEEVANMVQSEEVDRMRKVWEHEKKRLEEAVTDNITVMTTLRSDIQAMETTEEELLDQIKEAEEKVGTLTEAVATAKDETAATAKALEEAQEQFAKERAELETRIQESESALETRLGETKERMEELEEIALTVEDWKERCEAMQFEMIQKTAMVEDIGFKLAEAQEQRDALENTLAEKNTQPTVDLSADLEKSLVDLNALKTERDLLLVKVSELEAALALSASIKAAPTAATSEVVLNRAELEEEISHLKQMVHDLTRENVTVASVNKKLMQEHDNLMEAHKHVETECLKLMDEVERLHSESLAVGGMEVGEVEDKDELDVMHHNAGAKGVLTTPEELKAALNNVTVITKDTPAEKEGTKPSASVIRLESLLKEKEALLDRLMSNHAAEMKDLRLRYVELDRNKSWEITQLNKELTELESLIESKIFHEADLEEDVQKKQKQIDLLQREISDLKAQLAKGSNGSADLPPSGLSHDRPLYTSASAPASGINGYSSADYTRKAPVSGRTRTTTQNTDQPLFCEICEEEGHDLISCVAVFGARKTAANAHASHISTPVPSGFTAELEDDRPYCENCEEFGLHYTDECPNESLTY